jgi:hypothetical protein
LTVSGSTGNWRQPICANGYLAGYVVRTDELAGDDSMSTETDSVEGMTDSRGPHYLMLSGVASLAAAAAINLLVDGRRTPFESLSMT